MPTAKLKKKTVKKPSIKASNKKLNTKSTKTKSSKFEAVSIKKPSAKFKRDMEKILVNMRKDLLEDINNVMKSESDHLKFDVGDFYDSASSDRERELSLSLSQRDRQKLTMIEDALNRLKGKTYGQCQMCGDYIPEERLRVMPFTVYCVLCLEEEETSVSST